MLSPGGFPPRSLEEREASAKLHVHLGAPVISLSKSTHARIYPFAASVVYDLRNFTSQTLWGPFKADGEATVDWEKMEAIMIVLHKNVREFAVSLDCGLRPLWNYFWDGSTPDSFVSRRLQSGEVIKPDIDFNRFELPCAT